MTLLAAAATIDATPPFPAVLSGNGLPDEPIGRAADPIEWQALRLHRDGQEWVLITGDFLSIGRDMRAVAQAALPGLAAERLVIAASHTHSAPAIDPQLPVLGKVTERFREWCASQLRQLLSDLMQAPLQPAVLRHGTGAFGGNVYRRRMAWRPGLPLRAMAMLPDERVPVPSAISLYRVERADGAPLALVWNWACHPTCFPDKRAISADYPGVVRAALRAKHGAALPVLFLQGFAGDVRPRLYDRRAGWKSRIKRALNGDCFGPVALPAWQAWADDLAQQVAAADQAAAESAALAQPVLTADRIDIPLDALQDQPVPDRPLTVQRLRLTDDHAMVFLSCEPVCGLLPLFRGRHGQTLCAGYLDHIYGYLPSDAQVAEGGYEPHTFRANFSLPGRYYPDIEARLVNFQSKAF